jgi:hypothetical protein
MAANSLFTIRSFSTQAIQSHSARIAITAQRERTTVEKAGVASRPDHA